MPSGYVGNVVNFLTHEDVTWREAMDGSSVLAVAGLVVLATAAIVRWRRHVT